jgi:signal transduction histidine kinase/ActR/RegA family two-component response regulator
MSNRTPRILYMEDDRALARLVHRQLKRLGYEVDVAYDGKEGLAMYAAGCYDAVAVDQTMPGRDGLEVIRAMTSLGPLPPTIMVTGTGNEAIAVEAMKLGVSDYLVKDMVGGFLRFLPGVLERAIEQQQLTEQKRRAEEEVRALKQQIEFILGATKTGLDIIDSRLRLHYVDPKWQEIYGPPAGRTCHEYFMGRTEPCERCGVIQALKTKRITVTERTLPKENKRPTQVTRIPFQSEQGEWLVAEVNADISERKRMERELAQAQKMQAIGHLAAGIAHEINTPTQYIGDNTRFLQQGFDELDRLLETFQQLLQAAKDDTVTEELITEVETQLRRTNVDYLTAEIPKAIRQSLEGVGRVATIVRAMREFSHPEQQHKQAVDLNHVIESALTVSRNEWKYVAELVTDFDSSLPPVPSVPNDLHRVIVNLVVNAAQAIAGTTCGGAPCGGAPAPQEWSAGQDAQRKGVITVRTRCDGDWVEIRVEDTGTGIPEEIRPHVFDPFFTTKEVGKGTGQGLAIAHSIVVEKHGGTIGFETETGRGTSFIIRLPITDQPRSVDSGEWRVESGQFHGDVLH